VGLPVFVLGRSADSAIPLLSSSISRQHVQIEVTQEGVYLTDMNSNNGTTVDDTKVPSGRKVKLKSTNQVRLGAYPETFSFSIIPTPAELKNAEQARKDLMTLVGQMRAEVENEAKAKLDHELERLKSRSQAEYKKLMAQAEAEIHDQRRKIDSENVLVISKAKDQAAGIVRQANDEARLIQDMALAEEVRRKVEIQDRVDELENSLRQELSQKKSKAEEDLKAELAQITAVSNEKAKRLAEQMINEAREKAKEIIKNGEEHLNQVLKTKEREHAVQLQQESERLLANTKGECIVEQERIVASYQKTIEALTTQLKQIEGILTQTNSTNKDLEEQIGLKKADLARTEAVLLATRRDLASLQYALAEARGVIKESEEVRSARDKAKHELDQFTREYNEKVHSIESDLQTKKDAAHNEVETLKAALRDRLAKEELAGIEKIKLRIEQEENRYNETLRLRGSEIALEIATSLRNIEPLRDIPIETFRRAAEEVLTTFTSSLQPVTPNASVDSEKDKTIQIRNRRLAVGAMAVAVTVAFVFFEPLVDYLREASGNSLADYLVAKRTAESIYAPAQNDDWRESYVGNVLYLRNYVVAKNDSAYQNQWTLRLNDVDFLRSLKLNEDDIIKFQAKESALIEELEELKAGIDARFLDQGLAAMNQSELAAIKEMTTLVGGEENFATLRGLERDFTTQYLRRRFGTQEENPRDPADTKPE